MNLNPPGKSIEKIFQEREATACTALLGIWFYQCLLNNVFQRFAADLSPSHTTLESGEMLQQQALELWKAKPGPDLSVLEVPGFGAALACEEELKVTAVCKVSRGRKPDSYGQTSLVSSSLLLAPGPDPSTARGCHCRQYARWQWIVPEDLRHPVKPSQVHSKITPFNVC